jgi:predicted nucleotide-binding protein
MARKSSNESPLALKVSRERAEEILNKQADAGETILANAATVVPGSPKHEAWNHGRTRWIDVTVAAANSLFTTSAPADEFEHAAHPLMVINAGPREDFGWEKEAVGKGVNKLHSLRERLEYIEAPQDATARSAAVRAAPTEDAHVFVVHGHDDARKTEIARTLEKAGEHPVTILHEKPEQGQTLIEKFEKHAGQAGFAVILLTWDDVGGPRPREGEDHDLYPRGRQNVVFEMGFFFGALGRRYTTVLYEEGVELPSDIDGLVYIPLDDGGVWKYKLVTELKAAGLNFSLDKL